MTDPGIFPRLQEPVRGRYANTIDKLLMSPAVAPRATGVPQAPQGPGRSRYSQFFDDREALAQYRMLSNFSAAAKRDPDLAAQAMELGVEMEQLDMRPLPQGTMERNLPAIRELVEQQRVRQRMAAGFNPVLHRQLRDPDFAAIAYDDLPNLSLFEDAIGGLIGMTPLPLLFDIPLVDEVAELMVGRREVGQLQVEMARVAAPAFGRYFTETERARIDDFQQRMADLPQESAGIFSGLAYVIGQMAANSREIINSAAGGALGGAAGGAVLGGGPASPLTAAGGALLGGGTALTGAIATTTARVEAGLLYIDLLEKGVDPTSAMWYALGHGTFSGAMEVTGMAFVAAPVMPFVRKQIQSRVTKLLAAPVTTSRGAIQNALRAVGGVGGEVGTEVAQTISEYTAKSYAGVDPGPFWSQIADTIVETVKGTVLLAGAPSAVRFTSDMNQAKAAVDQHEMFERIGGIKKRSKTATRSESALEVMARAALGGKAATHVYIDAEAAQEALSRERVSVDELAQEVPEFAQSQVNEGGTRDLVIPMETYIAKVLNKPLDAVLRRHIRFAPEAPSLFQAQETLAQSRVLLAENAKAVDEQLQEKGAYEKSLDKVHDKMLQRQREVQRLDDLDARRAARTHREMINVLTAEWNEIQKAQGKKLWTPEQFDKKYGQRVARGEEVAVEEELDLQQLAATPAVQARLGKSKVRQAVFHGTEQPFAEKLDPGAGLDDLGGTHLGTAEQANRFATTDPSISLKHPEDPGPRVFPLFVKIENPLRLEDHAAWDWAEVGPQLQAQGLVANWQALKRQHDGDLQAAIKSLGFDGVVYLNRHESSLEKGEIGQRVLASGRLRPSFSDQEFKALVPEAEDSYIVFDTDQLIPALSPELRQEAPALPRVAGLESSRELATSEAWGRIVNFKQALQDRVRAEAERAGVTLVTREGEIERVSESAEDYLVTVGVNDAIAALTENPNAVGWYSERVQQALHVMAELHPEILTDEDAKFAFVWITAVTSNGLNVADNFRLTQSVYASYKATGKMPEGVGIGTAAETMDSSLALFDTLRDLWGAERLRKFMLTRGTAGMIKDGLGYEVSGENVGAPAIGAGILGAKIGNGFFANLNGLFDMLTMDRWLVRSWGRWSGLLIYDRPDLVASGQERLGNAVAGLTAEARQQVETLTAVEEIKEADGTTRLRTLTLDIDLSADANTVAGILRKWSEKPAGRAALNEVPGGMELRRAGNTLFANLSKQKEDPANGSERDYIRRVFQRILAEVRSEKQWADLDMADLQAALWFAEKRLYDQAKVEEELGEAGETGYVDDEAPDYANASVTVAKENGVDAQATDRALRAGQSAARRAAAGRRRTDRRGEDAQARARREGGLSAPERKLQFGGLIVQRARSLRGTDEAVSWSVGRKARRTDGKHGLLRKLGTKVVAELTLGIRLANAFKSQGIGTRTVYELDPNDPRSAAKFRSAISAFKKHDNLKKRRDAAAVFVYPEEDYAQMRLFLTDTGNSGVAVKADGDMVSVFSAEGNGRTLVEVAIASGATRGDAFATILPELYAPHGLPTVARTGWDETQKPPGWNKKHFKQFNGGRPDVVFMVYDPNYMGLYKPTDGGPAVSYEEAASRQARMLPPTGEFQQEGARGLRERIQSVGRQQRDVPEQAMLNVQRAHGGGVLSPVVENAGDLIHRMSEKTTESSAGFEFVREKVTKLLNSLTHPFGFNREHLENLQNNAKSRDIGLHEQNQRVAAALDAYTEAHRALQPVTEGQRVANEIAVAVGEGRWADAVEGLRTLESVLDQGTDAWVRFATTPLELQQEGSTRRGGHQPSTRTTKLYESADITTWMHESAHYYLGVLGMIATEPNAPAHLRERMETVLEWSGFQGGLDAWNAATFEQQRPHHEAFAHAFELYLWEGKSPSKALERIFQKFRSFMVRAYRAIRADTAVQDLYREKYGRELPALTGEVREVMDRMLATEAAIQHAEAIRALTPHFETQEASGMTDKQWADYQQAIGDSHEEAINALDKRSLKAVAWVRTARTDEERKIAAQRRATRQRVREEVAEEVALEPVNRARTFFKGGKLRDPQGQVLEWDETQKLDRAATRRMVPGGFIPTVPGGAPTGQLQSLAGMTVEEGGLAPDDAAMLFDYSSGQAMVEAMVNSPKMKEAIEAETNRRMEIEHSDLTNPEQIEIAIDRAIHNEARARFVAAELKALSQATKPMGRMRQAARAAAARIVSGTQISKLRTRTYDVAARRAAQKSQEASSKGDTERAMFYKRQELLQIELVRAVGRAKDERDRAHKLFKKIKRRDSRLAATRDVDYVGAARAILAAHDLGDGPKETAPHLNKIAQSNPDRFRELSVVVENATTTAGPWRDLTMEEFREMAVAVEAMWNVASDERNVTIVGERELIASASRKVVEALGNPAMVERRRSLNKKERKAIDSAKDKYWVTHVESMVMEMDGGLPGVLHKYLFQTLRDAFNAYLLEKNELVKALDERLHELDLGDGQAIETNAALNNYVFRNKAELVAAIRHSGNPENMRKLLLGKKMHPPVKANEPINPQPWLDFINEKMRDGTATRAPTITKEDMDYVQYVWNTYGSIWTRTKAEFKKSFGFEPPQVPLQPLDTHHGVYPGGYVPAKVDYYDEEVQILPAHAAREDSLVDASEKVRESVSPARGHTVGRVEFNQPLDLTLTLDAVNLDEHLRFVHMQNPSRDLWRLLNHPDVKKALALTSPNMVEGLFRPWIDRTVHNRVVERGRVPKWLHNFAVWLRRTTGKGTMFADAGVGVQQLSGIGLATQFVDKKYLRSAIARYINSGGAFSGNLADEIVAKSAYMKLRLKQQMGQLRDDIDVLTQVKWLRKLDELSNRHAYFMQIFFQNPVDIVTWTGRYEQSIAENRGEEQAIQDADAVVRRSQSSALAPDISKIEASNAIFRLGLQFSTFWMAQYNVISHRKGSRKAMAIGNAFFWAGLVAASLTKAVDGGWGDDDDDGHMWDDVGAWAFGETVSGGVSALAPVIGPALWKLSTGMYGGRLSIASSGTLEAMGRSVRDVWKYFDPEHETTGRNIRDSLTFVGAMLGVPLQRVGESFGYARDVERGTLVPTSEYDYWRGLLTGRASSVSRR